MPAIERSVAMYRKRWFPVALILVSLLVTFGGFYLAFEAPQRLVASTRAEAREAMQEAVERLAEVDSTIAQMGWFKPSYVQRPSSESARGHSLGEQASSLLARAESGGTWRTRLGLCRKALSDAKSARDAAGSAASLVVEAYRLQEEALRGAATLTSGLSTVAQVIETTASRIAAETPRYPRRYATEISARREASLKELQALQPVPAVSSRLLPPLTEKSGIGDPAAALTVLNPALLRSASLNSRCAEGLAWLDTVQTHYLGAPEEVKRSEARVSEAERQLTARKTETRYWLKSATALYVQARNSSRSARSILTAIQPGEKVADRPEAFIKAQAAITLCVRTIEDADAEIALARKVAELTGEFEDQIYVLARVAPDVEDYLDTLKRYHARPAWIQYSSIDDDAGTGQVSHYRGILGRIERLAGLDVQEFRKADELVRSELAYIDSDIDDGRDFIAFAEVLEEARAEYADAIDRAREVIEGEESDVSSYGSHDADAQSDFEDAVRLLADARDSADEKLYMDAVDLAERAASLASGTGSRAREAYDDYQARQRSESSNNSGFDFGGDSGGGSDFGSGGGSDFGSSGGSDFGGGSSDNSGSDSDAGGSGSDSDW